MSGGTARETRWTGGAHPLTVLRVTTTADLALDVLPDRCLDLGAATYHGIPIAWLSGAPLLHPADLPKRAWADFFVGGLLATCGLDNVGPACVDEGRHFPMHGRIASEPARTVRWGTHQVRGARWHWITGTISQPDSALMLRRRILIADAAPVIRVYDHVRNTGAAREPVMVQYHCNFGPPVVAPSGRVAVPGTTVVPRDAAAAAALDCWQRIDAPQTGEVECVFRHEQPDRRWSVASILLPPGGTPCRVTVGADRRTLPWRWQWRLLADVPYVIGLEPANCAIKPRDRARAAGALPYLNGGDKLRWTVEIMLDAEPGVAGSAELYSRENARFETHRDNRSGLHDPVSLVKWSHRGPI
jgi:hypothetical protein